MDSKTIRKSFIDFFMKKNHNYVRSSSVAPLEDSTLLFTNAGMNQFKPVFLGEQKAKNSRVVNSQKCIRVSGKHNDLEEVGVDHYHHTFFEMLGNWSFGDYYKSEAIQWAWELLTDVWGLEKDRLWATVYEDDDEAFETWKSVTDINPDRVLKFGAKDNFWEMGETGPCGPCSEIHYYIGNDLKRQSKKGINSSNEYWEIWNLVFIQYNRDKQGKLNDLPKKHVDTGAGFERIVTILQDKNSNYRTDLFLPIINKITEITGIKYEDNPVPHQVIADHIRMLAFSIADGVMPSNEGRGYVLRRILRRAARFGRMLDYHEPFIYKLVDILDTIMGDEYPEIIEKGAHIRNVIKAEETAFNKTLDRGLNNFDKIVESLKIKIISGSDAFKLYDTFGFPLDLTQLMARERGLGVDEIGFYKAMQKQKNRAKATGSFNAVKKNLKWNVISKASSSKFIGYKNYEHKSVIWRWAKQGDTILLILNKTPFYGESGGQVGDTGTIKGKGINLKVIDTKKDNDQIIHYCEGVFSDPTEEVKVFCQIDKKRRRAIKRNHTATHLLHAALKQVLGDHVHQAGSLVAPDYFRFDLTHYEKITSEDLLSIESIVNGEILKSSKVEPNDKMSLDEAREAGAEALFGEKYGDVVRVLKIGEFSLELCGGTHVDNTSKIGSFKIIEESSLAAGVRRIVAITGKESVEYMQKQAQIISELQVKLKCNVEDLTLRLDQLLQQKKELEKQLKNRKTDERVSVDDLLKKVKLVNGNNYIIAEIEPLSMSELKVLGDELIVKMKSGIGILGMKGAKKPAILVLVSKDLVSKGVHAGELAKAIGADGKGGGGGKPNIATAGARDNELLPTQLKLAEAHVLNRLKEMSDK
ncbi:alanine--tRNA ligase [Candidatus Neomarinimicrobiota bacterium]